jgi:integrase/recombinase XerD
VSAYYPNQLLSIYLKWLERVDGKALTTVNNRKYILRYFVGHLNYLGIYDIREVRLQDIDDYIASLDGKQKTSSINQVKQAIRHMLWYCSAHRNIQLLVDYELIKRHREKPPKIRIYTFDDVQRVIKCADNRQDALMVALMYETGIRIGELIKISTQDVRGTEIHVRGKGSYDRPVYMSEPLSRLIREHLTELHVSAGPIFRHQIHLTHALDNVYISTCHVRERIQRQFDRAGYKHMHPHELRHSFAYRWLEQRGDLRTLQKILGHSSLEVTQRYLQITDHFTADTYKQTFTRSVI